MSRTEIYPWSLLTEVGDYFAVPEKVKPFAYMSALVAQRNYRTASSVRLSANKTTYGTIVMVVQIQDREPPYEYLSPEGIMAITGKQHVASAIRGDLGERPVMRKRTVSEIVKQMSVEVKEANLPWWYDPKTNNLVFNPKVATPEDLEKWYSKQKMPGPNDPYPEYYHLDENLIRKSREQIMAEEDEPNEDEFFEVIGGEEATEGEGENGGHD